MMTETIEKEIKKNLTKVEKLKKEIELENENDIWLILMDIQNLTPISKEVTVQVIKQTKKRYRKRLKLRKKLDMKNKKIIDSNYYQLGKNYYCCLICMYDSQSERNMRKHVEEHKMKGERVV